MTFDDVYDVLGECDLREIGRSSASEQFMRFLFNIPVKEPLHLHRWLAGWVPMHMFIVTPRRATSR